MIKILHILEQMLVSDVMTAEQIKNTREFQEKATNIERQEKRLEDRANRQVRMQNLKQLMSLEGISKGLEGLKGSIVGLGGRAVDATKNAMAATYYGKIIKIYDVDGAKTTDRCLNCSGQFYNKPILGMPVVYGMKKESNNYYSDGKILDPKSGSLYSCNMRLSKTGKELTVRGYIGFSLLGRSQKWYRVKRVHGKELRWIRA